MRIFISVDIEGITGVSTWEEAADQPTQTMRERMTAELNVACRAALDHGATEIVIKDAHGNGKNILIDQLPEEIKVISGWSSHPYSMVEGLDDTYDGIIFMGYHSAALTNTSPIAHTLNPRKIRGIYLNDQIASEFMIFSNVAYMLGVPIIAVTGDGGIIREVQELEQDIEVVAVQEGFGGGMVSIHPKVAASRIEKAVKSGMDKLEQSKKMTIPTVFNIRVIFKKHEDAYKYSFYPGAKQIDEYSISYTSDLYIDILRLLLFI